MMIKKTELIKYTDELVSIKDNSIGIELSDSKWDKLFLAIDFENIFFKGERLIKEEVFDKNITNKSAIYNSKTKKLVVKMTSTDLVHRGILNKYWNAYEYSMLYITDNLVSLEEVSLLTPMEFYTRHDSSIVLYKSFEENVLWIISKNGGDGDVPD